MKKTGYYPVAIALLLLVAAVSCQKKSQDKTQITGKWKMHQVFMDTNRNFNADFKEQVNVDTANIYYSFLANGTLVKSYPKYNDSFVWVDIGNNYLNISNIHTTNVMHVDTFSNTFLVLQDTQVSVNGYIIWYRFTK